MMHPVSFIKIVVDIMKKRNNEKKENSEQVSVDMAKITAPKQTSGIMIITS
jgi:hypothetical protein